MASPAPPSSAVQQPDRRSPLAAALGIRDDVADRSTHTVSPQPHLQQRAASQPPRPHSHQTPPPQSPYDPIQRPAAINAHSHNRLVDNPSPSPHIAAFAGNRKLSTSSSSSATSALWAPPPASQSPIARPSSNSTSANASSINKPFYPTGSRSVSFSTFSDPPLSSGLHSTSHSFSQHGTSPNITSTMSALMAHLHNETSRFPSTFEDDEDEDGSLLLDGDNENNDDERRFDYATPRRQNSGGAGTGRSRPQSLGPGPLPMSSSISGLPSSSANANARRSRPSLNTQFGPGGASLGSSYGFTQGYGLPNTQPVEDHSNVSPFLRDVSQIYPDDTYNAPNYTSAGGLPNGRSVSGSGALYNNHFGSYSGHPNGQNTSSSPIWGPSNGTGGYSGMISGFGADEYHNGGGGSGTTSRRHSVSVLQPRRISTGFNPSNNAFSQDPPSPISATSDRYYGGGRGGGGMFSDEELAGSLNMLSLNNLDRDLERERRDRSVPRATGPSQPSSLPTYAPHHSHIGSPLDSLAHRFNGATASSPTSSLGAPGDEMEQERRRRRMRSESRSAASERFSDSESSVSRSPDRRFGQQQPQQHMQQGQVDPYAANEALAMAGMMGGRIPSPTIFRATDALKQNSALAYQDLYEPSDPNQPPSQQQTRGRSTSVHQGFGGMGTEFDSNVNTPRGPISLSPQNSVQVPRGPQGVPLGYPVPNVGMGRGMPPPVGLPSMPGQGYGAYGPGGVGNGGPGGAYYNGPPSGAGMPGPGPGRQRQNSNAPPYAQQQQQQQHQMMGAPPPGFAGGPMHHQSHPHPHSHPHPAQGFHPQQHQPSSPTNSSNPAASSPAATGPDVVLGRGVPLSAVPRDTPLYIVEFKAGRNDIFYVADPARFYGEPPNNVPPANGSALPSEDGKPPSSPSASRPSSELKVGDLVIVEADRGRDLGRVTHGNISTADVEAWQRQQAEQAAIAALQSGMPSEEGAGAGGKSKELMPKKIYSRAGPADITHLQAKSADEAKALQLCQSKVRQKKLPMEVVDAEYQWDRRKLTFYFVADRRIDFRELVRELFRLYKTRIWMACLQGPATTEA